MFSELILFLSLSSGICSLSFKQTDATSNKEIKSAFCKASSNNKPTPSCLSVAGMQLLLFVTTLVRNLVVLSTTSNQMENFLSNNRAGGSDCRAIRESCKTSVQSSVSSPDFHVFRKKANANESPARAPNFAKLSTGAEESSSVCSPSDAFKLQTVFLLLKPSIELLDNASNIRSAINNCLCSLTDDFVQFVV